MNTFTIGQVAERSGFSASALRYYEELGLIAPAARTEAGYRLYDDRALSRLAFVARAKQLGCSLNEITDLLSVWDGEQCGPVQRRFHDLVTDKLQSTQDQITELIAFTSQLQTAAARLDAHRPTDRATATAHVWRTATRRPVPVMLSAPAVSGPPIACTLQTDAMPERMEHWQTMLTNVRASIAMPDGRLRMEFDGDVDLGELTRLVAAEQQCCSFFAFT